MDRPSRSPLYLGIVLVVAGWAVLFLGWYQAGQQDLETGQIPYVISGGFGGWGLIVLGAAALVIDLLRQIEYRAHQRLDELTKAISSISIAPPRASGGRAASPSSGGPSTPGAPRRRRRRGGRGRGPKPTGESSGSS